MVQLIQIFTFKFTAAAQPGPPLIRTSGTITKGE
jgi:hypothetical protein